jgi:hypothetical protein
MKRELKPSGFFEQAKDATHPLAGSNNTAGGSTCLQNTSDSMVILRCLSGPAAGCRHLTGRDWKVLRGTGGAMVTGLMGADIGP